MRFDEGARAAGKQSLYPVRPAQSLVLYAVSCAVCNAAHQNSISGEYPVLHGLPAGLMKWRGLFVRNRSFHKEIMQVLFAFVVQYGDHRL